MRAGVTVNTNRAGLVMTIAGVNCESEESADCCETMAIRTTGTCDLTKTVGRKIILSDDKGDIVKRVTETYRDCSS